MKIISSLVGAALLLSACSPAQFQADMVKVQAALTPYEQAIQAKCAVVLPLAQSLPANVVAGLIPVVASVQAAVVGGCGTLEGIIAMANSATTKEWLDTAATVLASRGAILPPPVAPVPTTQ